MTNGSQGVGGVFKPVSGSGKMGDLIVTGYTGSYENNGISAVKLNIAGQNDGPLMYWVDADYGSDGKWFGWYNADWDTEYKDVPLASGEGLWFKCDGDKYLQSSGEVIGDTLPVTLVAGSQLAPNPTPVVVKMGAVNMAGYGASYENNGISAVKLNRAGQNLGALMYWVDADYGPEGVWYGWYNADRDTEYKDVELNPGEAVWLKCPTKGWTVNWPSPLKK